MVVFKKYIILFFIILMTSFSSIANAQDDQNSFSFSSECYAAMESLEDEVDLAVYGNLYADCFKEVYVDNTSTRIAYFIFGDIYLEALKFITIPFEIFINVINVVSDSNEDFNNINFLIGEANTIIDEVKNDYNNKQSIFFSGTVSSLLASLVFIINSSVSLILLYVSIKMIWQFQIGNLESSKNFSTNLIRIFSGLGLMAPFIGGYSLIQFVLLSVIGFGISLSSVFFILIYSSFLNMNVEELRIQERILNIDSYSKVAENVIGNYNKKIISNMCVIRETEQIISNNITDSRLVKFNKNHEENNIIKCLSDNSFPDQENNMLRHNSKLNYCISNHNNYFDNNNNKIQINAANVNCGSYSDNKIPAVKNFREELGLRAEKTAIKYHEKECIMNNELEQVGSNVNFNCIKLESIGNFKYNNEGNVEYFKRDIELNLSDVIEKINSVHETDNSNFHLLIGSFNDGINNYMISSLENSDNAFSNELGVVNREYRRNIERVIRNGWLHGFSIFMPKNATNNLASLIRTDDYSNHKAKITSEVLDNDRFNAGNALDMSESDLNNFYNTIINKSYYIGVDSSYVAEDNNKSGLLLDITPHFLLTEEQIAKQSHSQERFRDCVINRINSNCDFSLSGGFVINPIDNFYRQLNSLGDYIVGFYIGSIIASKITNSSRHPKMNEISSTAYGLATMTMAVYLLCTVIMVFTPFFVFISAILEWLYKLIKSPLYIQLFALWYVLPSGDSEEDTFNKKDQEKKVYKLLGEMILTPLFIIIGVLVSFSVLVISYSIASILSFIVFSVMIPSSSGVFLSLLYFFVSYSLFLVFSAGLVFIVSKKMLSSVQLINSYFGFDNFDSKDEFQAIINKIKATVLL